MRTCSRFPDCSRPARKGHKLCAKCKGRAWRAAIKPVARRDQLVEDSGIRFTAAGLRELDKLSWPALSGLIADLTEQNQELDRLVGRDE